MAISKKVSAVLVLLAVILCLVVLAVLVWHFVTYHERYPDNSTDDSAMKPWFHSRLPNFVIPVYYSVDLRPVLTPDSSGLYWFYGSSIVTFTATKNTTFFLIHSKNLNYTEVNLTSINVSYHVGISRYWFYEANDYLIVETAVPLEADTNYTLKTSFFGELKNDSNNGLYRSQYIKASGEAKTVVASQMEVYFARETFPCFDEPGLKATFDISLWHVESDYALSNMDVKSIENNVIDGWQRTNFRTTPRMSTYLIALVVCDFKYTAANTSTSPVIQTRAIAPPRQIEAGNADYANSISPKILNYYTEFFNVSYPLPKADQIVVPDFVMATAMENWGLVVYRDIYFLYNSKTSSMSSKQEVASVIAHELTHQWFGNIISPLWWDEIWLNEGFATYISYLGVDQVEPTWQMDDQFVVQDFHRAMSIDGLLSSRPIVAQNVRTKTEIDALFDAITYAKGACIIRMIRTFAGDAAFRLGLTNYIIENKYGSVTHKQLFKFWEQAIDKVGGSNPPDGFVPAMNTWVLQMGFPTVTLERDPENRNRMIATQERFLLDPQADPDEPKSNFGYSWVIPFWYATEGNLELNFTWIRPDSVTTISVPENEFILGNYEVFGYYRVNYDEENWRRIIAKLNENIDILEPKTRGQLLDDAFNLARANRLSYEVALNLSKILRKDFNYISWKSAMNGFSYFDKMLARSKTYNHYQRFLRYVVTPSFGQLGWNKQNVILQIFQQNLVLDKTCSLGNKICEKSVKGQFHQWMADHENSSNNRIDPDFRSVVYCHALAQGGEEEWDFVWKTYVEESDSQEKLTLLNALACTNNELLVQRLLDYTKNGTYIRNQAGPSILINLCSNDKARDIVWRFMKIEWEHVIQAYGSALFDFRKIIGVCTSSFSTTQELQDLKNFIAENTGRLGYGWKPFEQAVEQVNVNIQWRMRNEQFLYQWFQNVKF